MSPIEVAKMLKAKGKKKKKKKKILFPFRVRRLREKRQAGKRPGEVESPESAGTDPRQCAYSQELVLKPSELAFSETARLM